MYFYWIVFTLLIIVGGMLSQVQHHDDVTSEHASLDALSRGMLIYRSAAAEYARANPAFTGNPADATLSLPAWYKKPAGVAAYVTGGSAYTYYSETLPVGLPAALVERTESIAVGVKRSGALVSPTFGATGIPVPPVVPEGAVVAIN